MNFTHNDYIKILKIIKPRLSSFQLPMPEHFVLLRHDVEFNVKRALDIAEIESAYKIKSTYFFQVLSSGYNPFSSVNKKNIQRIKELGHDVGLHFYVSHLEDDNWDVLENELNIQKILFEKGLQINCNIFSYHRPPRWVLENRDDQLCGMINAYGQSFFEFSPNPKNIIYMADSQHKWSYGHPIDNIRASKIQILTHPDEWTAEGDSSNKEYFSNLIKDHNNNFVETLDKETKHFNEHKKYFL